MVTVTLALIGDQLCSMLRMAANTSRSLRQEQIALLFTPRVQTGHGLYTWAQFPWIFAYHFMLACKCQHM